MDSKAGIDLLTRFANRIAGSDVERRAALALRDRLMASDRPAAIEPFRFHQRWALAQAIAAGLAVVGSVISVSSPALGAALVGLAALSSILEATGVVAVLARLTGTRASQNVSLPPTGSGSGATSSANEPSPAARPGLLVLAASYDAPRESAFARLAARIDPWPLLDGALVAVLACCVLRLIGSEGDVLTAIQLVPTLALLAAGPLLVDAELAPIGDGAAEATGAEVAIDLAERLPDELRQLDVWLVLTGAGGALGAGMRAWRRRHRRELNTRPTVTIEIGAPDPDEADDVRAEYAELALRLDAQLGG